MKLSRKLSALTLTLLLVLSLLAGCGGRKTSGPDNTGDAPASTPAETKHDPYDVLSEAVAAAAEDVRARLDATPIPAVLTLFDEPALSAQFDAGFPDEDGEIFGTLSGSLIFSASDKSASDPSESGPSASADVTLSAPSLAELGVYNTDLPLKLYYGSDFFGIASPELFGTETFFGLAPRNISGQLSGTPIARLLELDDAALAEADRAFNEIGPDPDCAAPGFTDDFAAFLLEFASGRDAELTESGGVTTVAIPLPSADARRLLTALAGLLPDGITGITVDFADTLGDRLSAINQSVGDSTLSFTLEDGRLQTVVLEDTRPVLTLSLYGETGTEIAASVDTLANFTLELENGVRFDSSLGTEAPAITTLVWDADGNFDFITYRMDVTDLALHGAVSAEDGKLAYDGIWYTGERGDRNPLTFVLTPGGAVSAPAETKNAGELTQAELSRLTLSLLSALNSK